MKLSHRKAFELFQKSIDGRLSAAQRAALDRHVETCAECQTYVALHDHLKEAAPAYLVGPAPSLQDIQQTIYHTQSRFRRKQMLRRFFSPVQTVIWSAVAVALAVAVFWIFNSTGQQAQTSTSIEITPALTGARAQTQDATQTAAPTSISTSTPPPSATPQPPTSTPAATRTPRPTMKPTARIVNPGVRVKEEVFADVDLNCDGLKEQIVAYKTFSSFNNVPYDMLGIALQIPTQSGYRKTWEMQSDLDEQYSFPLWRYTELELLPINGCEQLLVLSTYVSNAERRLFVFRWNGRDMSPLLDVEAMDFATSENPLVVTVVMRNCSSPTKCQEDKTDYVWNGQEFILGE